MRLTIKLHYTDFLFKLFINHFISCDTPACSSLLLSVVCETCPHRFGHSCTHTTVARAPGSSGACILHWDYDSRGPLPLCRLAFLSGSGPLPRRLRRDGVVVIWLHIRTRGSEMRRSHFLAAAFAGCGAGSTSPSSVRYSFHASLVRWLYKYLEDGCRFRSKERMCAMTRHAASNNPAPL